MFCFFFILSLNWYIIVKIASLIGLVVSCSLQVSSLELNRVRDLRLRKIPNLISEASFLSECGILCLWLLSVIHSCHSNGDLFLVLFSAQLFDTTSESVFWCLKWRTQFIYQWIDNKIVGLIVNDGLIRLAVNNVLNAHPLSVSFCFFFFIWIDHFISIYNLI